MDRWKHRAAVLAASCFWACAEPAESLLHDPMQAEMDAGRPTEQPPVKEPDDSWETAGGPIDGELTVFVRTRAFDDRGAYVTTAAAGVEVSVRFGGQELHGLTGSDGRVDFADPDLVPPVDVHVLDDRFEEYVSWVGLSARVLSILLTPREYPSAPEWVYVEGRALGLEAVQASSSFPYTFARVDSVFDEQIPHPGYPGSTGDDVNPAEDDFRIRRFPADPRMVILFGGRSLRDNATLPRQTTHFGFATNIGAPRDGVIADVQVSLDYPLDRPLRVAFDTTSTDHRQIGVRVMLEFSGLDGKPIVRLPSASAEDAQSIELSVPDVSAMPHEPQLMVVPMLSGPFGLVRSRALLPPIIATSSHLRVGSFMEFMDAPTISSGRTLTLSPPPETSFLICDLNWEDSDENARAWTIRVQSGLEQVDLPILPPHKGDLELTVSAMDGPIPDPNQLNLSALIRGSRRSVTSVHLR